MLSEKLQKLRKENNITQEGLADKLNVSRQAVSKWESGAAYPDTEKLILISKIFNIKLDELINDNIDIKDNSKNKRIDFMEIVNEMLEFLSKLVNMFFAMKFIEKIKCLFEMGILVLIIIGVSMLSTSILVDLIRNILIFLPDGILYSVCSLFETLLFLAWIILGIIILVRIFKTRYLDYYVFLIDDNVSVKTIEEPIKELKDKKEIKVVIRDPKDSSLNIIKKIGKVFSWLFKSLSFLIMIPVIIFFILCIVLLVYSLFYVTKGLFFNGISLSIFGVICFIYLVIEFIYNLLFNRKHVVNRIFIFFIFSIIMIGIGLGLSFTSLSSFTYLENDKYETNTHVIDISDNLIINGIIDNNIIIDNSLTDIKLEITNYGSYDVYLYSYNDRYEDNLFNVVEISVNYNDLEFYKDMIDNLVNKKIVSYDKMYDVKMYISYDNLTKLKENMNKYRDIISEYEKTMYNYIKKDRDVLC